MHCKRYLRAIGWNQEKESQEIKQRKDAQQNACSLLPAACSDQQQLADRKGCDTSSVRLTHYKHRDSHALPGA